MVFDGQGSSSNNNSEEVHSQDSNNIVFTE